MLLMSIILSAILIAGIVLFSFIKPVTRSSYEEEISIPSEVSETLQQRGQLECLMPKQHSH